MVRCCHQLKPLPQGITEGLRKCIHISENDVKWKGELFHVRSDFRHLSWPFKYRYFNVQDRILLTKDIWKERENIDQIPDELIGDLVS